MRVKTVPVGRSGITGAGVGSCSLGLRGDREVRGSGDIVWSHQVDTDATASVAVLHVAQALRGC